MANHIVRADTRGRLVVISRWDKVGVRDGQRTSIPFSDPAQAIERCQAECEADLTIDFWNKADNGQMQALAPVLNDFAKMEELSAVENLDALDRVLDDANDVDRYIDQLFIAHFEGHQ